MTLGGGSPSVYASTTRHGRPNYQIVPRPSSRGPAEALTSRVYWAWPPRLVSAIHTFPFESSCQLSKIPVPQFVIMSAYVFLVYSLPKNVDTKGGGDIVERIRVPGQIKTVVRVISPSLKMGFQSTSFATYKESMMNLKSVIRALALVFALSYLPVAGIAGTANYNGDTSAYYGGRWTVCDNVSGSGRAYGIGEYGASSTRRNTSGNPDCRWQDISLQRHKVCRDVFGSDPCSGSAT